MLCYLSYTQDDEEIHHNIGTRKSSIVEHTFQPTSLQFKKRGVLTYRNQNGLGFRNNNQEVEIVEQKNDEGRY